MQAIREVQGSMFKWACVVPLLLASPVFGASFVNFTLELGGDNKRDLWKSSSPPPVSALFVSGSEADGQPMPLGGNLTWAIKVAAGGVQDTGNGAGHAIKGAANLVCNLELYKDSIAPGNLATGVIWNSTINDGTNGDISAAAAFAASYTIANRGLGRVIDMWGQGGPFMGGPGWPLTGNPPKPPKNSRTYPTAEPGKLIGIGAGYYQWSGTAFLNSTTAGVGIESGLGIRPVFEGQMDTTNLPAGTYVLRVVPGAGINVLRGDLDLTLAQNAFATAAEQSSGDTITFVLMTIPLPGAPGGFSPADLATDVAVDATLSWTAGTDSTSSDVYFGTTNPPPFVSNTAGTTYVPGSLAQSTTYYWQVRSKNAAGTTAGPVLSFTTAAPAPLAITGWRIIKTHPGVGDLSVPVSATGIGIDPRAGGVSHLAIDFTRPCDFFDNPAVMIGSDGSVPSWADYAVVGNTLEMMFDPPMAVGVCYTFDLAGAVFATDGTDFEVSGDTDCTFRVLPGDVTGNGVVNLGDVIFTKMKVGQALGAGTAKFDVNLSGAINADDVAAAKAQMGATSSCP